MKVHDVRPEPGLPPLCPRCGARLSGGSCEYCRASAWPALGVAAFIILGGSLLWLWATASR